MYNLCSHSSIGGYLGCFHVLAIVKKYKDEYKIHLIVNEDGVDPVEYLSLDWTPGVKPGIKLEVV